ncbi:hypothetical protein ACTXT7_001144 [Hymenolepis weldensis]
MLVVSNHSHVLERCCLRNFLSDTTSVSLNVCSTKYETSLLMEHLKSRSIGVALRSSRIQRIKVHLHELQSASFSSERL